MKDKTTAAILALFLGMFGVHRFYLRQPGLGILYTFLFFFAGISIILGIIDAIVFFAMDQQEFDKRYNEGYIPGEYDRYRRRAQGSPHQYSGSAQRQRRPAPHVPERARANPYIQSGIKKYKDFELEDAIVDFQKGLEISPRDVALHFNLACAYSLTEKTQKALYHLDKAVEYGFTDFEKIRTHDALAFVRIQPEFEKFAAANYRLTSAEPAQTGKAETPDKPAAVVQDDKLLAQLKRLAELRDKGLITQEEFAMEKQKLMR